MYVLILLVVSAKESRLFHRIIDIFIPIDKMFKKFFFIGTLNKLGLCCIDAFLWERKTRANGGRRKQALVQMRQ